MLWAMAIGSVGLAGGGLAWWRTSSGSEAPRRADTLTGEVRPERERRATLEPAMFDGKIRRAYEVAREIPGVLDRLRCYCHCEGLGHKSLLSCYVDDHAANCIICMDEALEASRMTRAGMDVASVRLAIDDKFHERF